MGDRLGTPGAVGFCLFCFCFVHHTYIRMKEGSNYNYNQCSNQYAAYLYTPTSTIHYIPKYPKDPKVLSLKSPVKHSASLSAIFPYSYRNMGKNRLWLIKTARGSFLCYIKYPSPQPNSEIRKPSIELKFTLISVTICSLIFFICNEKVFDGERPRMQVKHSCGRQAWACSLQDGKNGKMLKKDIK